jgi:hypothetical protein
MMCFSASSIASAVVAYIPNGTIFGSSNTPGDVSYTYNFDGGFYGSTATATFTSSPVASVNYETSAFNPVGGVVLSGGGFMSYRFEVQSAPNTYVPIDFSGLYSSSTSPASPGYGSTTSIRIFEAAPFSLSLLSEFSSFFRGDCGAPSCLGYTVTNSTYTSEQSDAAHVEGLFQGTFNILTGLDGMVVGEVQLGATGGVFVNAGVASATAFIEPHLEIDATWLASNPGAMLRIEAGVGNEISSVSAVPEPGSLALAGLALAGLGLARRKARRSPAG